MPGNICVDLSHDDPAVTIIDFGVCSRTDAAGDVGYLAGVAETLFSKGRRAPSLEDWLACDDGKDLTLDRLSEVLRDQLSWQGCLPEDSKEEPVLDELSEELNDQFNMEDGDWSASDDDECDERSETLEQN